VRVRCLSPALGAELLDVDLHRPIGDEDQRALQQALDEHHLLLVRGQQLEDSEHVAFAAAFGHVAHEAGGPIGMVSNVRADGTLGADRATWHSDFTFFPAPYEAISLYGIDIPASGTQTSYANAILAARTLPAQLRARLDGVQGRAVLSFDNGSLTDGVRYRLGRRDDAVIHQVRPVLWPHRNTGEPVLAVWEQQTDALLPLEPEDSNTLLAQLFEHLYRPEHQYVHEWAPNDLVLWDNHALQHSRPAVGVEEPRSLRRVCVGEDQDLSLFATLKAAKGNA
jgi:alpha-ketoglutarate-dependent taurine dioxygenase